ncbi:nucleotidyl transferase AbiEii/AbiGii toxin family protein [Pantoea phytobeneficialis]|uniref:Nucleotidyl transferase AbiEii/AbiGii toxin family protein n=1 Tax=Pantoea phytobeneficialis TaxID=2052056 RepID=A0AAP9H509_9GAMM|nr:nucleotidyl transferase AbiEii/AbiGii toxin family protein [Pantoea phytobeneficialis]MDO6405662.1 nucleotidyl transferase AbiEii/AbiGii toxin family protein [Pantoea phytobeneficialis]QGR06696.1 hypothetical protein CTZ24_09845 [Pantoea phytobeneficialis]
MPSPHQNLLSPVAIAERYGLCAFSVNVLSIERTVVEKIIALIRASREKRPDVALKSRIHHIYDLCMIKHNADFAPLFQDGALLKMLSIVEHADREQFSSAGDWLDQPLSQAAIFANTEQTWSHIRGEFHGRFAVMVYDSDLPSDKEVIGMLDAVHKQLKQYRMLA